MTPLQFQRVGEALFGERWQTETSRLLDVTDRTVRYWASGEKPMPERIAGELLSAAEARHAKLEKVIADLRKRA